MTQLSLMWGGTTVGDATSAPYSDDEFSDMMDMLLVRDRAAQGILPTTRVGFTNELAVIDAGGATARVQSGAALVDGKLYTNDANVDFTVSGASVHWIIGLRKSWAGQTVRAFARGNYASAALALASLVQTDGTTWEIPLATVLTTAGGDVSTVIHERKFVRTTFKRFFVPATVASTAIYTPLVYDYRGWHFDDGVEAWAYGHFTIPNDFRASMIAYAVLFKGTALAPGDFLRLTHTVYYGNVVLPDYGGTEASGNHVNTSGPTDVIPDDFLMHGVMDLALPDAAKGDIASLQLYRNAGADTAVDMLFMGWLVEYESY
jgi:hypothetical protein